ncbi:MAG: hypothetical protein HY399_05890 [Elusimicrobia bacterium]|nr:hypothetical protein [Elusimicrobiota bacterium]
METKAKEYLVCLLVVGLLLPASHVLGQESMTSPEVGQGLFATWDGSYFVSTNRKGSFHIGLSRMAVPGGTGALEFSITKAVGHAVYNTTYNGVVVSSTMTTGGSVVVQGVLNRYRKYAVKG